jgi:multiple sugar transport system permease protein
MYIFLAITLLPIVWMVFSSVKDSTDIAIGKVGLRRAGTEILAIVPQQENLLLLSADGGINLANAKNLKVVRHKSYKTAATAYFVDDNFIWIASSNKGLLKVDRNSLSQLASADIKSQRVDFNKVNTAYIAKKDNKICVGMEFGAFSGVWQFDANSLKLIEYSQGKKKQIFPNAGTFKPAIVAGLDGEIFSRLEMNGFIYYGASGGRIYKVDQASGSIVNQNRLKSGHLLVRFSNYIDMWKNVNFGLYLRNSFIICGFTMLFAMIFATFAAYSLSRFKFPGADLFSNATLATQMIPMIMYLIPIYIMFVKFTMLSGIPVKGTYPGIILIYSAWFLPFSIWILRGFFASIPKELEEAALIDGCSRFRVFWHVALPLAMPGIIATGIYIFLNAWDELMFAWVLTNADTMTIPVGIRLFVGNYQNRFDLMMAAATVATLPVVVLFFLLQKHIVRGLTAGAVKG